MLILIDNPSDRIFTDRKNRGDHKQSEKIKQFYFC
jgi:hypothetical protein